MADWDDEPEDLIDDRFGPNPSKSVAARFPITLLCPKCGRQSIVYNGNYYCDVSECGWVNPAVFLGKFTVAEADFADQLVEQYTGEPHPQNIQQYATDRPKLKRVK